MAQGRIRTRGGGILVLLLCWAVFAGIEYLALRTAAGIQNNDRLERTFESRSPTYLRFQDISARYGSTETDILVLFETDSFADPARQASVENFLIDVQFVDHIALAVSPFSFRVPGPDGQRELLLPSQAGDVAENTARLSKARMELPELQRLLSDDLGTLLVILVAPDLPVEIDAKAATVAEIRALADAVTEGTGVTATLTGFPVLRSTVVERLDADFVVLNVVGLVAGTLIATLALGSVALGLIISFTAHTARLWTVAAMVEFGFEVNAVTVTLPTLILVLLFAEIVHMGVETKRAFAEGVEQPLKSALATVLPAALLAAMTTGIAFAGLLITPSALVNQLGAFGFAAIFGATLLGFALFALVVVTVDRTFGMARICARSRGDLLGRLRLLGVARLARSHARLISAAGIVAILITTAGYLRIDPNYSLFEGLRPGETPIVAIRRIEERLGPMTGLTFEHPLDPPDRLAAAKAALTELSSDGPVLAASRGIEDAPQVLRDRLIAEDGSMTLLTMPYHYVGSAAAKADIAALETKIAATPALRDLGPVTGTVHVSAFVSAEILGAFTLCFVLAAVASGLIVALWLRNAVLGVIAVLPNILPVTLVGSLMWMTGMPLSFTSGIALTIAFGIAVDDTVHVLNRVRQVTRRRGILDAETVQIAMQEISPAVVLTSLVLIAGVMGTLLSSVPGLVDFGMLTITVFALALVADLLLLPALLIAALRVVPPHLMRF